MSKPFPPPRLLASVGASLAELALAQLHLLVVFGRLRRRLVKREAKHLADEHDDHLHDDEQAQVQPDGGRLAAKDQEARVREPHDDKRQRRHDAEDNAVLALGDVSLVLKRQERLEAQQGGGGDEDARAGLAGRRVVNLGLAVGADVDIRLRAADDEEDDADEHEEVEDALVHGLNDDVALAVDGVEDAVEQAQQHEDQRAEPQAVERHPADVEALVGRVRDGGQAQRVADDAREGEDDEEAPPAGALEAVLDAEVDGADEEEGVDGEGGDGDVVVGVEGAAHGG